MRALVVVFSLLIAVIAVASWHSVALMRLYRVVFLFSPDRIAHNFRTADEWLLPFRVLRKGDRVAPISPNENLTLPVSMTAQNKSVLLQDFLDRTAMTGFVVLKVKEDGTSARLLHERYGLGLVCAFGSFCF
jgi:uncharacterized membrane protein